MSEEEMRTILSRHMDRFRSWSHAQLAERIGSGLFGTVQDCLEHVEGTASDGTEYQMEFNAFWNDKFRESVRVWGSFTAEPQKPLLGFIPVYTADLNESFVMAPDGTISCDD